MSVLMGFHAGVVIRFRTTCTTRSKRAPSTFLV